MGKGSSGRILATILFTDVVGSTEIARELGDARWRSLLRDHNRIVRAQLKRFNGREIDAAGDGFFALFDKPGEALRCAASVCEGVREVGLEVRAGLHAGEVETGNREARGIAVHTAARIMGRAGGGEVLASAGLSGLVAGAGLVLAEHGTFELKGVEGGWTLWALTSVDGRAMPPPLAPEEAAARRATVQPIGPASRRRWAVAGAVVMTAVAAALLAVPLTREAPAPESPSVAASPGGNSVVQLNGLDGTVTRVFDGAFSSTGGGSTRLAVGEGATWIRGSQLVKIAGTSVESYPIRMDVPGDALSLAVGLQRVWIPGSTDTSGRRAFIQTLDAADGSTLARIPLPPYGHPTDIVIDTRRGQEAVWVSFSSGRLVAISPSTGAVERDLLISDELDAISFGPSGVWAFDLFAAKVWRVDPVSGAVGHGVHVSSNSTIAAGNDGLWVIDNSGGTLAFVGEHDAEERDPEHIGPDLMALAIADDGAVWIVDGSGDVIRYDPVTGVEPPLHISDRPLGGVAIDHETDDIWITVEE